ncbi:MAG: hypothetical protein DMF14_06380 [Verrucomicrobia bacterium]|nr:MAG: hypothetical protein DMF14_06380 [Verrucomicrobiota bacterium]
MIFGLAVLTIAFFPACSQQISVALDRTNISDHKPPVSANHCSLADPFHSVEVQSICDHSRPIGLRS